MRWRRATPPSWYGFFPVLAQVDAIGRGRHKSLDIVDAQELRQRAFASLQDLVCQACGAEDGRPDHRRYAMGRPGQRSVSARAVCGAFSTQFVVDCELSSRGCGDQPVSQDLARIFWRPPVSFTIENIALAELTPSESEELAARHLSHVRTGAMEVAQSIAREASGSPFLIEQFARYMPSDTTDTTGPSIRRAIERRLSELPDEGRRFARNGRHRSATAQ
jgi:hypothetical protein